MFAIAARYDQAEVPPLDPGNLWEAGLDYMVQAREVLSMLSCPLCCPVDVFILAKTASIIIVEEQHAKLSCFSGCGNSALVRLPHVAQAKKLKMESVGQMEHGWLYTGEQNSHIRQVTYKSSCRNGISYGMC